MKKLSVSALLAMCLALGNLAQAGGLESLTPAQQNAVKNGESVFVTEDVSDKVWPRVTFFKLLKATPEEAAAVFTDYGSHKEVIPGLRESKISKQISPIVTEVDYELRLPFPVPNEKYTVKNTLSFASKTGVYDIRWTMVRADTTRDIQGGVRLEPMNGGTLITYDNLVVPSSGLASLFRKSAMAKLQKSAEAMSIHIEQEHTKGSPYLQQRIQALRNALPR